MSRSPHIWVVAFLSLVRADGARAGDAPRPWPARIPAPPGMEKSPGPWADPADPTAWPNTTSRANSDEWLAKNHDSLKVMRPRGPGMTTLAGTTWQRIMTASRSCARGCCW